MCKWAMSKTVAFVDYVDVYREPTTSLSVFKYYVLSGFKTSYTLQQNWEKCHGAGEWKL